MTLYWGPRTWAIDGQILLEEIGKPYETEKLDVGGGAAREPPFAKRLASSALNRQVA